MRFEFFVGLRYLKAKRQQTFISIITFISILGVAVGVMALIVVISVMSGFQRELRDRILGTNSHLVVMRMGSPMWDYDRVMGRVRELPDVAGTSPFVTGQAMLVGSARSRGVVVRGIDPGTVGRVTNLEEKVVEGSIAALAADGPGIVVGKELAANLGVFLGDTVRVLSPGGHITPLGVVPRSRLFNVVGIFHSGLYEYDASLAYISMKDAQNFFDMEGAVSGVEVRVDDIFDAGGVARRLQGMLGFTYIVRDWMQMNRNLFSALRLEKITMFIILVLIVLVAAFNIVSTLIMMVMDKNRDIAVMKSMGAQNRSTMRIFVLEGLIIGLIGTILGSLAGLLLSFSLERVVAFFENLFNFTLISPSVYYIDKLPVQVNYADVALIAASAVILSFAATLYPSLKAARLVPAEALRYG